MFLQDRLCYYVVFQGLFGLFGDLSVIKKYHSSLLVSAIVGILSLTACQASTSMTQPTMHKTTHKTASGLGYRVIKAGTGKTVGLDDEVEIRFMSYDRTGKVLDGTMSGVPVVVRPSQMVEGLKEGLMLMQAGGVYELDVPAHLGYREDEGLAKQAMSYRVEVLRLYP